MSGSSNNQPAGKPFGIVVNLPQNDPMAAPHLLGDAWSGERWFESAEERDRVYNSMLKNPGNYRKGDRPSMQLSKIDPS